MPGSPPAPRSCLKNGEDGFVPHEAAAQCEVSGMQPLEPDERRPSRNGSHAASSFSGRGQPKPLRRSSSSMNPHCQGGSSFGGSRKHAKFSAQQPDLVRSNTVHLGNQRPACKSAASSSSSGSSSRPAELSRSLSGSFVAPGALRRQDSRMSNDSEDPNDHDHSSMGRGRQRRSSLLPVLNGSFKRQVSGTLTSMNAVRRLKLCARRRAANPHPHTSIASHPNHQRPPLAYATD